MPIPKRQPLLVLMRLEQGHAEAVKRILMASAKQVERDLAKLGAKNELTRAQLRAQSASIKALLAQDWSKIEEAVRRGRLDAAKAASEVVSQYEGQLLDLVMSPEVAKQVAKSEALRSANGIEAALRRMEGSAYTPLSKQVYDTKKLADGWVDDKINQALVSGWDSKRLAREIAGSINPDVRGGVSYAANRLARTEINNAFHASAAKRFEDSGLVDEVDWNLSTSHPEGDICDKLAAESPYQPRAIPAKPHPHCYCYLTAHLPDEDEFLDNLLAGKYGDEPWSAKVDEDKLGGKMLSEDAIKNMNAAEVNSALVKRQKEIKEYAEKLRAAQGPNFDLTDPIYVAQRKELNALFSREAALKREAAGPKVRPAVKRAKAVKYDPAKPSAAYKNKLTIQGDDEITRRWLNELENGFTEQQHRALISHFSNRPGSGFYLGGRGTAVPDLDDMGALRTVTPRGYPPGKTWADSGGAYDPGDRKVLVGDPRRSGSASTVLHEGSHALDYAYGDIAGTSGRAITEGKAYRNAIDKFQKRDGVSFKPYYSNTGNPSGYHSEIWAEGGARIMHARVNGQDPIKAVQDGLGITHPDPKKAREAAKWFVDFWDDLDAKVAKALA